jgi:hypothetical protein
LAFWGIDPALLQMTTSDFVWEAVSVGAEQLFSDPGATLVA